MTQNEEKLLLSANERRLCVLETGLPARNAADAISGDFIVQLLRGGMPGHESEAYSFGVRLRGAYITGCIDLREARNPDLGPLPPLLLENCILDGNIQREEATVISARHAFLSRLSLTGCQVGRIDLANAVVDGDLTLDGVHPLDDARDCQVTARGVKIKGRIIGKGATFRIKPLAKIPGYDIDDYPFDFTDACIDNSVYLFPEFTSLGGVCFLGAKVEGDIWCRGTRLVAQNPDRFAFRGQGLTCRGSVSFFSNESQGTSIEGNIDLLSARMAYLNIKDVDFGPADELKAQNATIDEGLFIESPHLQSVYLQGANIGAFVVIVGRYSIEHSTHIVLRDTPHVRQEIHAYGIAVRDSFSIDDFFGTINLENSEIGGKLSITRTKAERLDADGAVVKGTALIDVPNDWNGKCTINARNLDIGEDLLFDMPPNAIIIDGSRIRNNLQVNFATVPRTEKPKAFICARNITVDNNCAIIHVTGTLKLGNTTVGGRLRIEGEHIENLDARGIVVRGPTELDTSFFPRERKHMLDFDGGLFGEFHLQNLLFMPTPGIDSVLSLNDARIERDFRVDRVMLEQFDTLPIDAPVQAYCGTLSFYPAWELYEAEYALPHDCAVMVAFLRRKHDRKLSILLSGDARPIQALNMSGALRLDNTTDVAQYLRFYCSYVHRESGPCRIVESARDVIIELEIEQHVIGPIQVTPVDHQSWLCKATVSNEEMLFDCSWTVTRLGLVDALLPRTPVAELKKMVEVFAAAPFRLVVPASYAGAPMAHFFVHQVAIDFQPILDMERFNYLLRPLVSKAAFFDLLRPGTISLTGMRASVVRFSEKRTWYSGIQVQLESFDYDRLEIRSAVDLPAKKKWRMKWLAKLQAKSHLREAANKRNIDWLNLQFPGRDPKKHPETKAFSPQPHEHLARLLRNQGKIDEAIEVTIHRLALERNLNLRFFRRTISQMMHRFFRHGLRPEIGLGWCILFMVLGGIFFDYTNYGYFRALYKDYGYFRILDGDPKAGMFYQQQPILVLDSAAVSSLLELDDDSAEPSMPIVLANKKQPSQEYRCRNQVDPVLYPIELFVPLLDLKQQDKCAISTKDSAFIFRMFKFCYTVLGSIFTSLTVLAISGVLRRRVEQ